MRASTVWDTLREGSRFFMKEGDVYETLRALVRRLDQEGLDYAVIGAMALAAHRYRRFTEDVDILLKPETLARFREKLLGLGYLPAFPEAKKTFRDAQTGVKIEVMTTGEYPGDRKPKPVVFPDPVSRQGPALDCCAREADRTQTSIGTLRTSPPQGSGRRPGAHPSLAPSARDLEEPRP